ncbi:MAG: hypothetical protein FJ253_03910 [Phycisphaerae bacterium]|nr:hypothetical protein [Phycisphaerae bacterium]
MQFATRNAGCRTSRRLGRAIVLLTSIATLGSASFAAARADVEIPDFAYKTSTWKTALVTHDGLVWDKEFAGWVAEGEKGARESFPGSWDFLVRCTFAHCFSGGFVHELEAASTATPPISNFAANSACKYFETASASETGAQASWFSWYAHAFKDRAQYGAQVEPVWSFKEIAKRAYNAMIDGGVSAIPKNPNIAFEHVQHLSNGADDNLTTGHLRIAILFAGDPERRHINNMDAIRKVLVNTYQFEEQNIWIMCGGYEAGEAVPNVGWKSNAPATRAELRKALMFVDGFVYSAVSVFANGGAIDDDKIVKLFIWTTDHGSADAPILIGVGPGSVGVDGSAVAAVANPERLLFDAGGETNKAAYAFNPNDPKAINSFSTGFEEVYFSTPAMQAPTGIPNLYFSVDHGSWGLEDSDVERTLDDFREPAGQIYAVAGNEDNREFIRAKAMGLVDTLYEANADVTALSMSSAAEVFNAGVPNHPIFWTVVGSPDIWVWDKWRPNGMQKLYKFWSPATDGWQPGANLPGNIDALGLYVNTDEDLRVPMNHPMPALRGRLKFKKGIDAMVFSVPKGDAFNASGCTIFRWNGNAMESIYSCNDLGLDDGDEVDALHAFVRNPFRTRSYGDINDPVPPQCQCAADFNQDCVVDGNDLGTLLGGWGSSGPTDLTGDGITNGADLGTLLGEWGPCN